jgi:hypothetical protein
MGGGLPFSVSSGRCRKAPTSINAANPVVARLSRSIGEGDMNERAIVRTIPKAPALVRRAALDHRSSTWQEGHDTARRQWKRPDILHWVRSGIALPHRGHLSERFKVDMSLWVVRYCAT